MYLIKIVKNKYSKTKIVVPFTYSIYFNFYFSFPFPTITFQKQNLFMNSKHIWWLLTWTYQKVVQKVTDIVENISLLGFSDSLAEDNLIFIKFKISFAFRHVTDQTLKKQKENIHLWSLHKRGLERGVLKSCHVFVDFIILNNRSIAHFFRDGGSGRVICCPFFVDVINGWPQRQ